MDDINNEINEVYFNLIAATIRLCFTVPKYKNRRRTIESRIIFAHSKMLNMWCDCADGFEYKKLRKKIIDYNKIFVFGFNF